MYIKSLELRNFRTFRNEKNDFVFPSSTAEDEAGFVSNVNLLLGINGAGKTTILKAIALAILAPVIQSSGYKPYYLVRRQGKLRAKTGAVVKGDLVLDGLDLGESVNGQTFVSHLSAKIISRGSYETVKPSVKIGHLDKIFEDDSPACFLVGYGATRRVENVETISSQSMKRRGLRYQRVAGLFEDYITLFPLGAWLPHLQETSKTRYAEIKRLFQALVPVDTEFTGQFENLEPIFKHKGIHLPFSALSDGYRAYLGMMGDLIYHLQLNCPAKIRLKQLTGIVLIDDLDLHLHPNWQRTVVPNLARTFPSLQFVITSHSPILVGTLHARNIRIVEDSTVKQLSERVHGLSADQILTSSYFNLNSSRSVDEEDRLNKISEDVAETNNPDGAIAFLRRLSGKEG